MRHYILFFILFIVSMMVTSCSKEPIKLVLDSMHCMENAMRINLDKTEALLSEMDVCIEKYRPIWEQTPDLYSQYSDESLRKEIIIYVTEYNKTLQHIMDLDLAIQDRLKDNPQMRAEYMKRINAMNIHLEMRKPD